MRDRPDRGRRGAGLGPFVAAGVVGAALVAAPLIALIAIRARRGPDDSGPRLAQCAAEGNVETGLLLLGVAAVTSVVGLGTAWIVTAYRFPGRAMVAPALMLPLAVPTYIVAYVYVELLDPLGPAQSIWRSLWGFRSRAEMGSSRSAPWPGRSSSWGLFSTRIFT
jgi:iron(III) transport system permease protein